uniref:EOG090X02D0 n=1 Tax=Moina brachiata TaxID=675436 RepID=A0A4Y7NI43_9CRUS|nr:EOG090X02D0 [Moina brachiata]SVE92888.1 EOG090X02D0 [Moina brachiata]
MANISRARSRKRAKGEIRHFIIPAEPAVPVPRSIDQPLNLCVRDDDSQTPLPQRDTPEAVKQPEEKATHRRKKRSAIFLPPEKLNENNVCICKFKFVAGHSPRLQEKKVLSLDSGGNFRFFPEAQQQSQASPSTSPPVSAPKPLPDLLPIATVNKTWPASQTPPDNQKPSQPKSSSTSKKLSRRQKMEQTFGDKGFLIQTQHVPATEGGAFCKFRQLKKFTRYLYRSWRHYLPEENQPTGSTTAD